MFAVPLREVEDQTDGHSICVGGLVVQQRKMFDKRVNAFAFVTLEDMRGDKADIALWSEAFSQFESHVDEGSVVLVEGRVSERNGRISVHGNRVTPLETVREQRIKAVNVKLVYEKVHNSLIGDIRELCVSHVGNSEFVIHIQESDKPEAVVRSKSLKVKPSDEFIHSLGLLVGVENVSLSREIPKPEIGEQEQWRFGK